MSKVSTTATFAASYPSVLESEGVMFADVERFLRDHGIEGRLSNVYRLCVSEAFSNALTHGNGLDPQKHVTVRLQINANELCADIQDQGSGGLTAIERRPRSADLDEGGRGVDLILGHATSVRITEPATGGTRIAFSFARSAFRTETEETSNDSSAARDGV